MPNFVVPFRKLGRWTLLIAFSFGLAPSGYADAESATLSVHIADPSGAVVASAGVMVRNTETNQEQHSSTGNSGTSIFSFLKPGHYALLVTKDGFDKIAVDNITLNVGDDKFLNLVLKVGSTSQSVNVDGSGLNINTTDASVSTVIDRNFVANMPLNGRSFQSLMTLAPGVAQVPPPSGIGTGNNVGENGEIVVNGQRTEANYFTVDGVSANTGVSVNGFGGGAGTGGGVAGETALGSTQSLVSIDALQEFRASTSTYSAEYGRTPGGQFSFATRSGTNIWHGSAFDYLRNDAMDAANWFNDYLDQPKGRERQNDFGGTLGGPVRIPRIYNGKDKTFFFFSYEGLRLNSPQGASTTVVPDMALRQASVASVKPILDAFPIPDGGEDGLNDGFAFYIQDVSYPAALDNTSVRIDHNLSDKFKIFGRYADTPSNTTSYSAAVRQVTSRTSHVLTLGSTNLFSARQSNEFRFNFTQAGGQITDASTALGGATPFSLSSIPGAGGKSLAEGGELYVAFAFGNFPSLSLYATPAAQKQFNLTDTYTWTLARHTIKAGIDWRRLATTLPPVNPEETVVFTDQNQIATNTPLEIFVSSEAPSNVEPIYQNYSSFIQDEWKSTDRLTLSLGLRWDINPAPYNAQGQSPYTVTQITDLATTQVAPAGTSLWKTDWLGFAPRIGLAYIAHQNPDHATVIRAGFGIFYDMGNTQGSQGYYGAGVGSSATLTSVPFPLTSAQLALPAPSIQAPYNATVFAFDPNLKLPYSLQYNLALEQALGKAQSLTVNYVGAGGRRLLTQFEVQPATLGNPNFTTYGDLELTQGRADSAYNSLQVKYQRELLHGLQTLASYTWSHSIDDASTDFLTTLLLRGNSDFDIRHNLQAALTYEFSRRFSNTLGTALFSDWGLDMRLQAHSSLPVNVQGATALDTSTGTYVVYQPNRVSGQPVYLYGNQYPGKRVINYAAFAAAPAGVQGDVPRNFARGFDAVQVDTAIHRDFHIYDRAQLQFRAEAFNIANHPNFGSIYNLLAYGPTRFGFANNTLNGSLGGLNPLYQVGGPRSLQMSLRLSF
jgi:hypothetical protein